MHDFQLIEDGVIGKLTSLLDQGVRTLDAYSGQLDVEEIEEITLRFPCIYVLASPLEAVERNQRVDYEVGVALLCGDKNLRGSRSAARGDHASKGVYRILEEIRGKLHHVKVAAGWSPLVLLKEAPVIYEPKLNLCLYQAEYRTKAQK